MAWHKTLPSITAAAQTTLSGWTRNVRGYKTPRFQVSPLVILTSWLSQNASAVSLDDLQSSRVTSRACDLPLFHLKRYLIRELLLAYGLLVEFTRCTVRPSEMPSERGLTRRLLCVDTPPPSRTGDCFALATDDIVHFTSRDLCILIAV